MVVDLPKSLNLLFHFYKAGKVL